MEIWAKPPSKFKFMTLKFMTASQKFVLFLGTLES